MPVIPKFIPQVRLLNSRLIFTHLFDATLLYIYLIKISVKYKTEFRIFLPQDGSAHSLLHLSWLQLLPFWLLQPESLNPSLITIWLIPVYTHTPGPIPEEILLALHSKSIQNLNISYLWLVLSLPNVISYLRWLAS